MAGGHAGRPRDPRAHAAILDAVLALVAEVGYERLTIEGIATRAGVGKQTVYRWWHAKSALVVEAVLTRQVRVGAPLPDPSGDLDQDLRAWLDASLRAHDDPATNAFIRALAAAAADRADDADRLYAALTGPARDELVRYFERCRASGQIRADADLGIVADTLAGTMLFRVLAHRPALTAAELDALVALVVGGIGTSPGTAG